jgi:hypothetical protein
MATSRRQFLASAATGATLAPLLVPTLAAGAGAPAESSSPLARGGATRTRLSRTNRNLFNGDTCTFFYNPELWQPEDFTMKSGQGKTGTQTLPVGGPFQAKAIRRYVQTLKKGGIDTFVINANASKAWYPSKTTPSILDGYRRGDREFFRGHAICAGSPTRRRWRDSSTASSRFSVCIRISLTPASTGWRRRPGPAGPSGSLPG